jgi:hypothetical protein
MKLHIHIHQDSILGREASNLMYPKKPDFHDALIKAGYTYKEVKGADGKIYHKYTKDRR